MEWMARERSVVSSGSLWVSDEYLELWAETSRLGRGPVKRIFDTFSESLGVANIVATHPSAIGKGGGSDFP